MLGDTTSGAGFGLLALRVGVGATILQAGMRKALAFESTAASMEAGGWRMPTVATAMVTVTETVGGIGLLLGLLTPLAACAVAAAMFDAWAVMVSGSAVWSDPFNLPFVLALGAVALLFTGAGAHSLDQRLWARADWPRPVSVTLFVIAIAAAVATWVFLNGTNPFHLTAPGG